MPEYKFFSDPRLRRLVKEHRELHQFCEHSDLVRYETIDQRSGMPPEKYRIYFQLKSIIGIDADQSPIYGEEHIAEIELPRDYPLSSQPKCWMKTTIWHPNIKHSGPYAGKICINAEALGHWHTLDMLASRLGEMLQYKNYHAENVHPHPEDAMVAQWVREYAEPNGIVNKKEKIYTDDRPLQNSSMEWINSRSLKNRIKIGKPRSANNNDISTEEIEKAKSIASKRRHIRIKRKNFE